MRTVTVKAPSGQYEVKIGAGLLPSLGAELRTCTGARRCAVISGENVFPLYGSWHEKASERRETEQKIAASGMQLEKAIEKADQAESALKEAQGHKEEADALRKAADKISEEEPSYQRRDELTAELVKLRRNAEIRFRRTTGRSVLEEIMNPTNLGAIFRSAAALGADAVLLTPGSCDPLYRRCVRVSMGTVFQVPWAHLSGWPEPGLGALRALGFRTAALALRADSISPDDPALREEAKLALVLGTEGDGLAADTIARCDYTVRIPMSHGVDSLNVAAAGAVAFYALRYK